MECMMGSTSKSFGTESRDPEHMTSASFMSHVRFRPTMECRTMESKMYSATMFKKGS